MLRLSALALWLAIAFTLTAACSTTDASDDESSGGSLSIELTLRDHNGRKHSLRDIEKHKLVVVAFLGTECPLAALYGPRIQELSEEFSGRGVAFVGVNSNVQDSLTEVAAYANRFGLSYPILMDNEHKLADALEAERTPEVFVVNSKRQIVYRGRIDDQYAVSVKKNEPTRRDLAEALSELLEGKPVSVARTEAIGCHIGRATKIEPVGEITFTKHVAPIFYSKCAECHRDGEIAPFPLITFEDTVGWEETIAEVIDEERMPPWNANPEFGNFKNDCRLSDAEKQTVLTWIDNGCPQGDPAEMPPPPSWVTGWRMPKPDQIIPVRDEPFQVQATGVVKYKYWEGPTFDEDKYVAAAEARPGNPAVVHHIIAYIVEPGSDRRTGLGNMLIGYAPGTSPLIFPEGSAMKIPKGSKLLFELHYTPNGREQEDLSQIGIRFIDRQDVRHIVLGGQVINHDFRIPAREDNFEVVADERVRDDVRLISLTPHMHVRGKSFRYEAFYPDGQHEILLDVPRYDFNWQLRYEYEEPKFVPKGTKIVCTAVYDNSAKNPNNPDPDNTVKWGQQSWEEMMIGFYTAVKAD